MQKYKTVNSASLLNPGERYSWNSCLNKFPPEVKKLALRYPPRTKFLLHGKVSHVIAYDEASETTAARIQVTEIDPANDYEGALLAMHPICECCIPKLDQLITK